MGLAEEPDFEEGIFIPNTELFLGEYIKATKEECYKKIYYVLNHQENVFSHLNNFYLDIAEPNAPKMSKIAINLIDRFDTTDPKLYQNYFGLLKIVEEAYYYGVDETNFGDINKSNGKVLRPSWLNQVLTAKSQVLETYLDNSNAVAFVDDEDYDYFINIENNLPFVVLKDNIFEMQMNYLDSKYKEERMRLWEELSKKHASRDYYT